MWILFLDICRGCLAVALIMAGYLKWQARPEFTNTLSSFGISNASARRILMISIPSVEVLLGLLLLGPWFPKLIVIGCIALLLAFSTALAVNLLKGQTFSCQCFGKASGATVTWIDVIRNLILIGCGVIYGFLGPSVGPIHVGSLFLSVLLVGAIILTNLSLRILHQN